MSNNRSLSSSIKDPISWELYFLTSLDKKEKSEAQYKVKYNENENEIENERNDILVYALRCPIFALHKSKSEE